MRAAQLRMIGSGTLSLRFSLSLLMSLLVASSGSALSYVYDVTGSSMAMANQTCTNATCNVPVTGTMTLADDGAGNVSLSSLNLAHAGYEVADPPSLSVILTRTSITLAAGSVSATPGGSTTTTALFGGTTFAQVGTSNCTPGLFPCTIAGYPTGVSPLGSPQSIVSMGTWTFDASHNLTHATFTYESQTSPSPTTETLTLVGTVVPEPGTGLLVLGGLLGLAGRDRPRVAAERR